MRQISYAESLRLEDENLIVTYYGSDAAGQRFFAYILCEKAGLQKAREDFHSGASGELQKYGKVIFFDWAEVPHEMAKRYLREFVNAYPEMKEML